MSEQRIAPITSFVVDDHQALIAVPMDEDGHAVTRYFLGEEAADHARLPSVTQEALQVVGAWRDVDWEQMAEALDRIRHESKPTPPIEL